MARRKLRSSKSREVSRTTKATPAARPAPAPGPAAKARAAPPPVEPQAARTAVKRPVETPPPAAPAVPARAARPAAAGARPRVWHGGLLAQLARGLRETSAALARADAPSHAGKAGAAKLRAALEAALESVEAQVRER